MKFALAISAKKVTKKQVCIKINAAYEAVGKGIEIAKEEWPESAGWEDHDCRVCEVPK